MSKLLPNDKLRIKVFLIGILSFISFSFMCYKLYDLIINNNEYYETKLSIKENKTYVGKVAKRGRILDRNGKVLVDNKEVYVLNYIKSSNITSDKELELCGILINYLNLDYEKVSIKELKEYFYLVNYDKLIKRANKNVINKYKDRTLSSDEYKEYLKKLITNDDINNLSLEEKKISYLYSLMNKGYRNDIKLIKEDITSEEVNDIKEYMKYGFSIGIRYKREYPYKETFRKFLGNVGNIPLEEVNKYLEEGYRLNDEVGISYLEKEYESILRGQNEEYVLTATGKKEIVKELKDGNDITLSIDIDLQKDIEDIIYKHVVNAKKEKNTKYYNKSYVILSNPNTGEIYASAGIGVVGGNNINRVDYLTDLTNYALTPGSIVKGASHLVGYKYGAIKIGTTVNDSCIKVKNTPEKCSWKRLGKIDDLKALKYSSNYYQFLIAIKIGEGKYKYNAPLVLNKEGFKKYREIYNQFGLGVKTGLDIPNEGIGVVGSDTNTGSLIDYPIGQYETYTSMELMQYINTLATSGKRYSLHFLKDKDLELLNNVDVDNKYIERVKLGLKMVMESGGTGASYINKKYKAAGKTGTAQSFIDTNQDGKIDKETISASFGAYMPYDNPRISIVVFSPNVSDKSSSYMSKVNRKITKEITDLYFDKYDVKISLNN